MTINNLIKDSFQSKEQPEESSKMRSVRLLLLNLLMKLIPIDFSREAGIGKDKLSLKHYLIITIKHILLCAEKYNWSLCSNHGRPYFFNGQYWEIIDKDDLTWFLGEASKGLGMDEFDAEHYEYKDRMQKQFTSQANFPRPEKRRDVVLINLKNGTLECRLEGCKLREFDKRDFLTYQLNFDYDPEAKAPLFMEFLNKVQPKIENQKIIGEFFASTFVHTSTLKLEKALLLYGEGANGKSVIFEIIFALLGNTNVSCFSLANLVDSTGYNRAMLSNKLLNYASEINGDMEADYFKLLSSGEPVPARHIYGAPFTLDNYSTKFCFNCNNLPRGVEHSRAFFRRFIIVLFEVIIPENEQDRELSKKIIQEELSGVLNWLLDGLKRLFEQKQFTYSESVENALKVYQTETDSVQQFLEDEFWEKSERHVTAKYLSGKYSEYCRDYRYKALNHINFLKRLRSLGVITKRHNEGQVVFMDQITPRPDEEARKQRALKDPRVHVEKTEVGDVFSFDAKDGHDLKCEGIV